MGRHDRIAAQSIQEPIKNKGKKQASDLAGRCRYASCEHRAEHGLIQSQTGAHENRVPPQEMRQQHQERQIVADRCCQRHSKHPAMKYQNVEQVRSNVPQRHHHCGQDNAVHFAVHLQDGQQNRDEQYGRTGDAVTPDIVGRQGDHVSLCACQSRERCGEKQNAGGNQSSQDNGPGAADRKEIPRPLEPAFTNTFAAQQGCAGTENAGSDGCSQCNRRSKPEGSHGVFSQKSARDCTVHNAADNAGQHRHELDKEHGFEGS